MNLRIYPAQINDIKELLTQVGNNLILVEVGSYQGESMELFANSNKFKQIYCVDSWEGGYDSKDISSSNNYNEVEELFDSRAKKFNFVKKIKKCSLDAAKDFEDESIDMIYIDAMHTPDAIRSDIQAWLPKVKKNGYISGHDWYYEYGILQQPIISLIGQPDYICKHIDIDPDGKSDGSWIKNKQNIIME